MNLDRESELVIVDIELERFQNRIDWSFKNAISKAREISDDPTKRTLEGEEADQVFRSMYVFIHKVNRDAGRIKILGVGYQVLEQVVVIGPKVLVDLEENINWMMVQSFAGSNNFISTDGHLNIFRASAMAGLISPLNG